MYDFHKKVLSAKANFFWGFTRYKMPKFSGCNVWNFFASQHECQWRKIQAPIGIDSSRLKVKKKFDMLPTLLSGLASAQDSR